MIDPSTIYQLSSAARYRKVAGEGVILQQTSAEIMTLNDTGADVLELIDGERSVQDIIEAMRAVYDADPADIARDVEDYLGQLVETGVICEKKA